MLTGLLLVASSACFFQDYEPRDKYHPQRLERRKGLLWVPVSGYNVSQHQDTMYHGFRTQCIVVLRYDVSQFCDTMYRGFRIQCITAGKAWRQEYEATATLYLKLESLTRRMLVLSSRSRFPQFQEGLWPIRWCQPQQQLNLLSQVYLPGSTLRKIQLCVSCDSKSRQLDNEG